MQSVRTSHVLWAFIEGLYAISTNISCVMGVYGRLTYNQYEHLMCYGRLLKACLCSVRTSHMLLTFIEGLYVISTNISCSAQALRAFIEVFLQLVRTQHVLAHIVLTYKYIVSCWCIMGVSLGSLTSTL